MPMSVYVLVSFVLSALALNWASADMKGGCSSNYLLMLMGMAVCNSIFAVYFQCKLWSTIMKQEDQFVIDEEDAKGSYAQAGKSMLQNAAAKANAAAGRADAAPQAPGPDPTSTTYKQRIPAEVIHGAFVEVILYDLIVLVAFVALCGLFVVSWMGPATLDGKNGCKVQEHTKDMGYVFFWVAVGWSFTYRYCACCAKSVVLVKEKDPEE